MDNLATRVVSAVIAALVAGVITALILWVIAALVPGLEIDTGLWGLIVGILVGLYTFLTRRTPNL